MQAYETMQKAGENELPRS